MATYDTREQIRNGPEPRPAPLAEGRGGAEIVGQLLLMAAERGAELGYGVEDLVRFLRTAAGSGTAGAGGTTRVWPAPPCL